METIRIEVQIRTAREHGKKNKRGQRDQTTSQQRGMTHGTTEIIAHHIPRHADVV